MTLTYEDHGPVVRVRHPEDLLALIPHELGHHPRDECVVAVVDRGRGALFLAMDRPPADAPAQLVGRELSSALDHLAGAAEVAVVVYLDHVPANPAAELAALTGRWQEIARAAGLNLLTALLVSPQCWWDPAQPELPRALTLIEESPVNAHLVALGSAMEPPAPKDDPRWHTALRQKARELAAPDAGPPRAGPPRAGAHGERNAVVAASSGPTALAAWERTLRCVARRRRDWVAAVLATPTADLRDMLAGLQDEATRTSLFYMLLCGDLERAQSAWLALGPALDRVRGALAGHEPGGEAVEEALRCMVAVAGEWEGPPHWESIETAHRVLQVVEGITHAHSAPDDRLPPGHPLSAETGDSVLAALAQLEIFRGRAHCAARLLARGGTHQRGGAQAGGGALTEVRRRLQRQATPWWCTDPVTGWPGRHWWARQNAG